MPSTLSDFYWSHQGYRFLQNCIPNEFWMTREMLVFHFLNVSKCAFRRRFRKNPGEAREVTLITCAFTSSPWGWVERRSNWSKMAKSRVKKSCDVYGVRTETTLTNIWRIQTFDHQKREYGCQWIKSGRKAVWLNDLIKSSTFKQYENMLVIKISCMRIPPGWKYVYMMKLI